jgi:hypothetical protein
MDDNHTQDAYAALVADCMNKRVSRSVMLRGRTEFVPHDAGIEMDTLPVFCHPQPNYHAKEFDPTDSITAMEAMMTGNFRLPYPRCAFISYIPSDIPALTTPTPYQKNVGRYYVVVAEEEDDGILFFGFVRHDDMRTWARQVWQAHVTATEITWAYEAGDAPADFIKPLTAATEQRLHILWGVIHKITTKGGSVTEAIGGSDTRNIDARRQRLGLSPVPRVRILKFDETPAAPSVSTGSGASKRPHHRHGTWRNLKTGRKVWVRAAKIHGGGAVPPWYELESTERVLH